jgi:hypothetical protein
MMEMQVRGKVAVTVMSVKQPPKPNPCINPFPLSVVPGGGIEPPQGFWPLRILSPLRLPISPSRRGITSFA